MKKTHLVLLGFFLSVSFHFYFPLLTLYFLENGLTKVSAPLVFSGALAASAFLLPYVGRLLDQGKFGKVLFFSSASIFLGLITFVLREKIHTGYLAGGAAFFICGTAFTYTATRRLTEGMAARENLGVATAKTYFAENAGIGVASILAFFFIQLHTTILVAIDALSTIAFALFLYLISKKNAPAVSTAKVETPTIRASFSHSKTYFKNNFALVIASVLVIMTCFANQSALQVLFSHQYQDAKATTALVNFINTLTIVLVTLAISKKWIPSPQSQKIMSKQFVAAALLVSLGYALTPWLTSRGGLVSATILWSFGEALIYPVIAVLLISAFPSSQPGLAVGVKDLFIKIGLILSPVIAALFPAENPMGFSLIYGSFPLIALVIFFHIRRRNFLLR